MSSQIVGQFKNESTNVEKVLTEVLNTGQARQMHFAIAHDIAIPQCRYGTDDKGISIILLRKHGYGHRDNWLAWRRSDYKVREIHDPHTLGPVFAFCDRNPGVADTSFELTQNLIDLCKWAYSATRTGRSLAEIKTAIGDYD